MSDIERRTGSRNPEASEYLQAIDELKAKIHSLENTRAVVIAVAAIFGISGAFGSWLLKTVWNDITKAQVDVKELRSEVGNLNLIANKAVLTAAQNLGLVLTNQEKLWIEAGQTKKDVGGTLTVKFKQVFTKEPVVIATGLWEGAGGAGVAQGITSINTDRFVLSEGNFTGKGHDYYVTWVAIGQH